MAKVDDFAPFPVKDQLPGVEYCVSSSPNWRIHFSSLLVFRFVKLAVI